MRIWNEGGRLTVDENTRISRVLGVIVAPAASGSVISDGLLTGTLWFRFDYDRSVTNRLLRINVVLSGANVMSWTYVANNGAAISPDPSMRLVFGVY